MNDEYIYCALNDCNENKGYSRCCLYCNIKDCPERCDKKSNTYCHCLMAGLKELKDEDN